MNTLTEAVVANRLQIRPGLITNKRALSAVATRPRVLVLFCAAGGDSMGWHRAGFDVTGVDIDPQPRYPFKFIQADAFDFFAKHGREFDFVAAGPMCRDHTPLTSVAGFTGTAWQLASVQEMLVESGMPYVLENVPASPLKADIVLCGKMFDLRVKRHRKFKSNVPLIAPAHPDSCRTVPTATKKRRERWDQGWDLSVTGDIGTYYGPEGMGIGWMNGNELSQAIPPAYTEYIGQQVMAHLANNGVATCANELEGASR